MKERQLLRCAVVTMMSLASGSAWAQQAPPASGPTTPPSAVAAASGGTVVAMQEPQPGDHWTYQVQDEITGKASANRENVVTEVTPKNISMRFKLLGTSNEGFNVYDRDWNLLSSGDWKYTPYQGNSGVRLPLTAGKSWTFQSDNINNARGLIWKESGTSKVVGQETITTKAGTFETFKIETNYSIKNVKDPSRKSEVTAQTWYAPAIDHWVKRIFVSKVDQHVRTNETYELIDYGRKQ
jgi:hypothetical protein